MELKDKLEKLVKRLENMETLSVEVIKPQIAEIQGVVIPELDEEFGKMLDEAEEDEHQDKDMERIINEVEDLFIKVDSLLAKIRNKYELDIEELSDGEFDDELERSVYDDEDVSNNVSDEEIEFLFNEVAKSALHKIGYDDSDPRAIDLMGNILAELASGEKNDDIIYGKILAPLMLSGFYAKPEEIKGICAKTREQCGMQVLGLQIAINTMREYKCSAYDALMQISNLLQ